MFRFFPKEEKQDFHSFLCNVGKQGRPKGRGREHRKWTVASGQGGQFLVTKIRAHFMDGPSASQQNSRAWVPCRGVGDNRVTGVPFRARRRPPLGPRVSPRQPLGSRRTVAVIGARVKASRGWKPVFAKASSHCVLRPAGTEAWVDPSAARGGRVRRVPARSRCVKLAAQS